MRGRYEMEKGKEERGVEEERGRGKRREGAEVEEKTGWR